MPESTPLIRRLEYNWPPDIIAPDADTPIHVGFLKEIPGLVTHIELPSGRSVFLAMSVERAEQYVAAILERIAAYREGKIGFASWSLHGVPVDIGDDELAGKLGMDKEPE